MEDTLGGGKRLMREAEKKMNSSPGFLSKLVGVKSNLQEASDLYLKAAGSMLMAQQWIPAGMAYYKAASLQKKLGNHDEAASNFVNAGSQYRKSSRSEAVASYLSAIEMYTDMSKYALAAKQHVCIAQLYATKGYDLKRASSHYERAAEYYKAGKQAKDEEEKVEEYPVVAFPGEPSNVHITGPDNIMSHKCLMKVAKYSALLEHYTKAISIYEEIANDCLNTSQMHYSVKDLFLRALLCRMCLDLAGAQKALRKYESRFPGFTDSRECRLIKILMKACEEESEEVFSDAVHEYQMIMSIDSLISTLLGRLRNATNLQMLL